MLADLQCNVLAAEVWTHRMRVACVVYVNDVATGLAIDDPCRVSRIETRLRHVLRGYGDGGGASASSSGDDGRGALANFAVGSAPHHVDRRLHQLMHADVDVDGDAAPPPAALVAGEGDRPVVTVEHCEEKSYSVVNVKCRDRSKLLFDIVCTLTDMHYVVFHAAVSSEASYGIQVYTRSIQAAFMSVAVQFQTWRFMRSLFLSRSCTSVARTARRSRKTKPRG